MESRTYYYARVSSREQNLDRQLAVFAAMGAQERDIITDKESGKDLDRSGYTALKTTLLRRGDTLVVKSLDRLSRNKSDIKNELQHFKENGIRLKVLDLPTTLVEYPAGQEWVLDMVNMFLTFARSAFLPCAASLSVESSFRIEGFFSCVSFFAENSLKAAVSTSASRPLKKTR